MKIDAVAQIGNSLTFLSPSGDGMRFAVGDVVQADVLSILPDGNVSIRITTESGRSGIVAARSEVPLAEGESILLKVVGGEREVALRFLGVIREEGTPGDTPDGLPEMYRELASELTASRLSTSDVRQTQESFLLLPEDVKGAVPGFETIGRSPGMEGLDGRSSERPSRGPASSLKRSSSSPRRTSSRGQTGKRCSFVWARRCRIGT